MLNTDDERYFTDVLDDDEKLLAVFKPNKRKLFAATRLPAMLIPTVMTLFMSIPLTITVSPYFLFIPIGAVLLSWIITSLVLPTYYDNLFYAYTDKRLITRTGIWGVDYRFLMMDSIGAVNVYVSPLDKMIAENTGSLVFGSMSAPMGGENYSGYRFAHIDKPYERYKTIKTLIQNERLNNGTISK